MRFFSKPTAKTKRASRRLTRVALEQLEGRQLLTGSTLGEISAVQNAAGQVTSFGVAADHSVWAHDAAGFHNLGGYAKSITASIGPNGNAEVFAIGSNNGLCRNVVGSGQGWQNLGGYVKQISANTDGNVYGIGSDNTAWEYDATGWHGLGGPGFLQVSASNGEVYAIGANNAVYQHATFSTSHDFGWENLGGQALQISATTDGQIYAIGTDHELFDYTFSLGGNAFWRNDGGYVTQISANDAAVFGIGGDGSCHSFHAGQGWSGLGGLVTSLGATQGNAAAVGSSGLEVPVDQVFAMGSDNVTPYVDTLSQGFQKL
jgi:hypothetical protein